ncbi:MAG: helix-turn-helix domain-containing protein [Weissella confusa]
MFSKEIQIEAVSMYLKGVPTVEIRRKFRIKAHSTLEIWVKSIKQDGIYGIKDSHRNKTSYPYSFKIKVINWRLNHNASYPITGLCCQDYGQVFSTPQGAATPKNFQNPDFSLKWRDFWVFL